MKVSIIVAVSKNGVIGDKGKMPWHFSEDAKYFKRVTMGCPVIMGRKTWESLPKPLPGRRNVIVTRDTSYHAPGGEVETSIDKALSSCMMSPEVFIIGGEDIYRQALKSRAVDRAYVTHIENEYEGDTKFDPLPSEFKLVKETKVVENEVTLRFCEYHR